MTHNVGMNKVTLSLIFLPKLRKEVRVGSLYIDDYRNSFGIDPHYLCDFFEAYEIWLEEDSRQDSDEALKEWYECHQEPITTDNLIKTNQ